MPEIGQGMLSHIDGVVPQLDDGDKLAVSIYAGGAAVGDTQPACYTATTDANPGIATLYTSPHPRLYNEATWDRQRNNAEVTLLASAVRAAGGQTAIQTNYNAKGAIIWLNITVVPGADTIRMYVYALEPLSSANLVMADTGVQVGTGLFHVLIYPGAIDSNTIFTDIQASPLPRSWRVNMIHSGAGNFTYSVTCSYLD